MGRKGSRDTGQLEARKQAGLRATGVRGGSKRGKYGQDCDANAECEAGWVAYGEYVWIFVQFSA